MRSLKHTLFVVAVALVIILAILGIEKFPWLLLLPVAVAAIGYPVYLLRRVFALHRRGYFITNSRQHPVIYEERRDGKLFSIPVRTVLEEPSCHHVLVPTQVEWQNSAPDWAKNRRDEIFKRIIEARPKGWVVLPDDWMA